MLLRALLVGLLCSVSVGAPVNASPQDTSTSKPKDNRLRVVPDAQRFGLWNKLQGGSDVDYGQSGILFFPTLVIADVPVYNLPDMQNSLNFSPEALAGIFLGQITYWDDPLLVKADLKTRLPHHRIVVIHRQDETGTTVLWTDYLSKVSAQWKQTVGEGAEVSWPVGKAVVGDDGVVDAIKHAKFSIAYMERSLAVRSALTCGRVRNLSGNFLARTLPAFRRQRLNTLHC